LNPKPIPISPNLQPSTLIYQLELLRSGEGTYRGSLLWLMGSNTVTAAGGRLMRRWVAHPLTDHGAIEVRPSLKDEPTI